MFKHKLLNVSSHQKVKELSQSTSEFYVNLGNSQGIEKVKSIVLKKAVIPNTQYNINRYTRTFAYSIGGVTQLVIVPEGQYTVSELIPILETSVGLGLNITVNQTSAKLTFSTSTPIRYLTYDEGNQMAELLGIVEGTPTEVSTHIASGSVAFQGLKSVFIISDKLGENNFLTSEGKSYSILGVVPITVPYGQIEHYSSPHPEIDDHDAISIKHGKNIQLLDIKLADERGNILDLNGHNVDILLKIYF